MRAEVHRHFLWMTLFFVAMAFLESSVVVYLRALYYPTGFSFPLVPMDPDIVVTEAWRELATLIMIWTPAAMVSRSALERFAWFCYGFGIWDLFYYLWLKVLLDWPDSLATMDLLFLLPVPWVGPVWAPCLVSAGLIVLALIIHKGISNSVYGIMDVWTWSYLLSGASLMVLAFVLDPMQQAFDLTSLNDIGDGHGDGSTITLDSTAYLPRSFQWGWFLAGCALALAGLVRCHRRATFHG